MTIPPPLAAPVPPAATLSESALFDLLAAYQYLQNENLQMVTHLTDTLQLGPTDLRFIVYLYVHDGTSPKQLAEVLDMTGGSVTALIDRAEHAGHIQRRKHPHDRRALTLHLTDTGISVVHQVRDAYQHAFNDAFSGPDMHAAAHALRILGDSLHTHLTATT